MNTPAPHITKTTLLSICATCSWKSSRVHFCFETSPFRLKYVQVLCLCVGQRSCKHARPHLQHVDTSARNRLRARCCAICRIRRQRCGALTSANVKQICKWQQHPTMSTHLTQTIIEPTGCQVCKWHANVDPSDTNQCRTNWSNSEKPEMHVGLCVLSCHRFTCLSAYFSWHSLASKTIAFLAASTSTPYALHHQYLCKWVNTCGGNEKCCCVHNATSRAMKTCFYPAWQKPLYIELKDFFNALPLPAIAMSNTNQRN